MAPPSVNILEFRGEYRFLSNFWPSTIVGQGGFVYPTVEHAYQAAKTNDFWTWKRFAEKGIALKPPYDKDPSQCLSPSDVKAAGSLLDVRSDWDDIKVPIMTNYIFQKFCHTDLRKKLMALEGYQIEEGNTWGDHFWGVKLSTREGENNLGKILMTIRDAFLEKEYNK